MAKRKLLIWMREKLVDHATKNVSPANEAKVFAAAYKKAEPLVRKLVQAKCKPADMACAKYELTKQDTCIRVQFAAGGVEQFVSKRVRPRRSSSRATATAACTWPTTRLQPPSRHGYPRATPLRPRRTVASKLTRRSCTPHRPSRMSSRSGPEVATLLPEANDLIPINPDQIAILKDLREREAA